ncbi:MAG: FkbM family methyltransferase [Eubacterium sp.]|nr:FkbM family methyltransferase [Eubacterium sp.]
MDQRLSEKLRNLGFAMGGKLLNSDYFSWFFVLLRKTGIVRLVHVLLDCMEAVHPTEEMLEFKKIKEEHKRELRSVYQMLEDEKSKAVYKDLFFYRCTKDRRYLTRHIGQDIYFNELTMSGQRDVFVDAGAFHGDTVQLFCKKSGEGYKHIYAFEVDRKNIDRLKSTIQRNKISRITVEPYVTGSGGMVASVVQDGSGPSFPIHAVAMDDVLKGRKVSFIKMDIEGAEQKALEGAKHIIRTYKPKLAVSIYHKADDFYKIPLFLHELVPEYQFYVRHYTCFYADTVLYAICR